MTRSRNADLRAGLRHSPAGLNGRLMKAVNALRSIGGLCLAGFAGAGLFPAAARAVGWGDEKWGEMVWGGATPVPALSSEGLLVTLVTVLLTGVFFAMRRRRTTH